MNSWFQDGYPQSYKIQLIYHEIPKHIKEKYIDTPYRFKSLDDATINASEIYQNVKYRIIPSNDKPHWKIQKK